MIDFLDKSFLEERKATFDAIFSDMDELVAECKAKNKDAESDENETEE